MDARAFPHLLDAIVEAAAAEYASSSPSRYPWSRPLSPSAPCCLRPDSLLFPARPQPVLSSSTVPGAPLLALRATSRRVRDRFDAQLADHVAWTRGEWFTPKLRRIPSLYDPTSCTPAQSDLCLSDTPRSAQEAHPRILDVYDNLDIELFDNWNRAYTIDDTGDKGEDDLVDDMSKLIFPGLEVVRCSNCYLAPVAPIYLERLEPMERDWNIPLTVPDGVRRYALRLLPCSTDRQFRSVEFSSLPPA